LHIGLSWLDQFSIFHKTHVRTEMKTEISGEFICITMRKVGYSGKLVAVRVEN